MNLSSQITIAAAILALNSGGWVRNTALSVGVLSGAIAIIQTRPRKQVGLTDSEVLELAIASSTKQIEEYEQSRIENIQHLYETWESDAEEIEKLIDQRKKQLAELDKITDAELDAIATERQRHIQNLNNQIDELSSLLDEQLAEIEVREQESIQRIYAEVEQHKQAVEAELEAKRQQLETIAQDDEAWLAQETERLTQQLEEDKRIFLEKHQGECISLRREADRLLDEIDLLKSELSAAYQLLEKYEEPELPRGFDIEKVVAYKLQKFWRDKGIITYLISAYPDEANRRVLVRLRPKTGGQKQFKKEWLNELQVQEDLPEPPGIQTVGGAIEFEIKPRTWTAFKPWDDTPPELRPASLTPGCNHPSTVNYAFEKSEPVTQKELEDFQPPCFRIDPQGAIKRIEQVWVISLWESGVRTQSLVCSTVYRSRTGNPVAKGDGSSFINARERMYSILDLQGITYIRRGA